MEKTVHELLAGAEEEYQRAVANRFARNLRVNRAVQQETVAPEVPQDGEDDETTIIIEQTGYRPSRREVIEAERAAQEDLAQEEAGDVDDAEIPEELSPQFDTVTRPEVDLAQNKAGATARRRAEYEEPKSALVSIFKQLTDAKSPARNWRLGAEGEELVAKQIVKLQQSDSRWQVVHDIRVGKRGANIDQLLVGPAGVFVIDSKHWRNADRCAHNPAKATAKEPAALPGDTQRAANYPNLRGDA